VGSYEIGEEFAIEEKIDQTQGEQGVKNTEDDKAKDGNSGGCFSIKRCHGVMGSPFE
jgi:hypothetical protein